MFQAQAKYVHQIFYDEPTRGLLDLGFLPIDNSQSERPDWFEFLVIRDFLHRTPLDERAWYGFLSPRFREKTGLDSSFVFDFIDRINSHADVALFSARWDLIAFFRSPFEQGEIFHPGLLDLSERFLQSIDVEIDLRTLTTHSLSSVYSNFIVAKPVFWRAWLKLADAFFDRVEHGRDALALALQASTTYAPQGRSMPSAPMKTFIQERLTSLVLAQGAFRVATPDLSGQFPFDSPFERSARARRVLQCCDLLKQQYATLGDPSFLEAYLKLRAVVPMASGTA